MPPTAPPEAGAAAVGTCLQCWLLRGLRQGLPWDWLLRPENAAEALGLNGEDPLAWWAADRYEGRWRQRVLHLRRQPQRRRLQPLLSGLLRQLRQRWPAGSPGPRLVVIPSWKRRCNPLPPLLARQISQELGWPLAPLLRRSRPVLPQHRLNASLRRSNQAGSFRCDHPWPAAGPQRREVLLIDDILTTGATALAAAEELERAGWLVAGLACLGRTPARGDGGDLRSIRRQGDRPG